MDDSDFLEQVAGCVSIPIAIFSAFFLAMFSQANATGRACLTNALGILIVTGLVVGLAIRESTAQSAERPSRIAINWLRRLRQRINRIPRRVWRRTPVEQHIHEHVVVRDLGLLLYSPTRKPAVYRHGDLPDDITHLRPFALIWMEKRDRRWLRFILRDSDGVIHFEHAAYTQLEAGDTFVPSKRWLSMDEGLAFDPSWKLTVYEKWDQLATQHFEHDVSGGELRAYLDGDGELRDDLLAALDAASDEQVSLDELLGE